MNKITVLIVFLLLNLSINAYERTLDACAIFKNEARSLAEKMLKNAVESSLLSDQPTQYCGKKKRRMI